MTTTSCVPGCTSIAHVVTPWLSTAFAVRSPHFTTKLPPLPIVFAIVPCRLTPPVLRSVQRGGTSNTRLVRSEIDHDAAVTVRVCTVVPLLPMPMHVNATLYTDE